MKNENIKTTFTINDFRESADYIMGIIKQKPEVGIVLGSGLGKLADSIQNPIIIPYASIPHFVNSTAIGHKGNFVFGTLAGKKVLAMQGRFHFYEGYTMQQVTFPIRVMHFLGITHLFVSNAAGGINPQFKVGDLMLIRDHINLLPNPLIGKNIEEIGPRFLDMTCAYDTEIIAAAKQIAIQENINLKEGVYLASTGPTFETPAEYGFFGKIGADAVGMSTVPEVIIARHCGMKVFGMSVISNEAHSFTDDYVNDGNDVIIAADKAADKMTILFRKLIGKIGEIR